jgi:hypothetical protein
VKKLGATPIEKSGFFFWKKGDGILKQTVRRLSGSFKRREKVMKRTQIKIFFFSLALSLIGMQHVLAQEGSVPNLENYRKPYAFVTTSDYETGFFATINVRNKSVTKYQLELSSDAVARTIDGKIYVVNRFGQDNITVFSPQNFAKPLIQFSTGNGSNPHDIVLASSNKAYVSLYEKGYLLVVDPTTGIELKRIDISSFADKDGVPEADRMVIVDGILYVALQKLDRNNYFEPAGNGEILMIDIESDTIIGSIVLSGANPYDIFYHQGMDRIVASEVGSFYDLTDGGIETVDPYTREASGFILTESDLGGDITEFAMTPFSGKGYIIVIDGATYDNNTSVVSFDLERGEKLKDILAPKAGFIHSGIALGSGRLLVGDRNFTHPGVRIISVATDREITTQPLDTGLPPNSITMY